MAWNELNAPRFDRWLRKLGGLRQAGALTAAAGELTPVLVAPNGLEDHAAAGRIPFGTPELVSVPPAGAGQLGYIGVVNDSGGRLMTVIPQVHGVDASNPRIHLIILPPPFQLAVTTALDVRSLETRFIGRMATAFVGVQPTPPVSAETSWSYSSAFLAANFQPVRVPSVVLRPESAVIIACFGIGQTVTGSFSGFVRTADDSELIPLGL